MKVGIIGAGASGLPAIKICLEYGFDPVCFEKQDDIGGLWNYKEYECEEGCVMKSTVINTSKEMTAYSDFPPPKEFANFMHNSKMQQYLRLYADRFQLLKYVRFNTTVIEVRRAKDYERTGKYDIQFKEGSEEEKVETFDAVLLCSGHHVEPYVATFKNHEAFEGSILHSHSYKDHRGYEDKRVVVIGIGNSGGDIAVELSRIAKQVYLVTRRGSWVINRIFDQGVPIDIATVNRLVGYVRHAFPKLASWLGEYKLNSRFDHATYGLKPKHGVFQAHPTVNDELPNRIACGMITIKPDINEIQKNGVSFVDGSEVDDIDTIIVSTGYSFGFPYLEKGSLIPVAENQVSLFKNMYTTELPHPSMAIIGLIQPIGSVMPISEMQCRLFCDVLSGRSRLPDRSAMNADIALKKKQMAEQYVKSRRHTIQVDYDTYMDELADLMDAKPDIKQTMLSDPLLGLTLVFGPLAAYQYRLRGPHPWPGARDALMTIQERVTYPTTNKMEMQQGGSKLKYFLIAMLLLLFYWVLF